MVVEILHGEEDDYVYLKALDEVLTLGEWAIHQRNPEALTGPNVLSKLTTTEA